MPASITVAVHGSGLEFTAMHRRLHGLACTLFESDNPDRSHHAPQKPFSVSPLMVDATGQVTWRLGWLLDEALPARLFGPVEARLGSRPVALEPLELEQVTFEQLVQRSTAIRAADVWFLSPTWFTRNGKDIPYPDPTLLVHSLTRRWNELGPTSLAISAEQSRTLAEALHVSGLRIETVRTGDVGAVEFDTDGGFRVRPADRSTSDARDRAGFVGFVRLGLDRRRRSDPEVARLAATLLLFAGFAGVGARTAQGCGAVQVVLEE